MSYNFSVDSSIVLHTKLQLIEWKMISNSPPPKKINK